MHIKAKATFICMYRARVYNGKKYKAHGKNGRKRKKKI